MPVAIYLHPCLVFFFDGTGIEPTASYMVSNALPLNHIPPFTYFLTFYFEIWVHQAAQAVLELR